MNELQSSAAKKLSNSTLKLKAYKNEKNLMLYPFCSTSKRKRTAPINYSSEDGKRWLEVTANVTYGMAKIWDFDIIRFVISKVSAIAQQTGFYPDKIAFTAYECLKFLNREPKAGKNIAWLRNALDRLVSTTYKGNIFKDEIKRITSFTLIKYEYQESDNEIEKIIITLDERLIDSIKQSGNVLRINQKLIREEAGIKKRLLELVEVSTQIEDNWIVSLEQLQKLCANDWKLTRFKFEISSYNDLPWQVKFFTELKTTFVEFKKR